VPQTEADVAADQRLVFDDEDPDDRSYGDA